jgi:formate dehydrogenase maturation protein FdhE
VKRGPRGGPGEFGARRARVTELLGGDPGAARAPLTLLDAVLRHQESRQGSAPEAPAQNSSAPYPLLDLEAAVPLVAAELPGVVEALLAVVTPPLAEAADRLQEGPALHAALVESWVEDMPLVDPRLGFWVHVAAGPVLEGGARRLQIPSDWHGSACPVCGGPPQASVIAEESGEFMGGSPRSLVCGRCASWWNFTRAVCPFCAEQDPKQLESFMVDDRRWARVDTCGTCKGYIKTFDLREKGAGPVVPLVDDVATLTLDVWAREREFSRTSLSLAGV